MQTAWEPPGFVIGQLRQTANLSEGNTVRIGHLNGLAGNIFVASVDPATDARLRRHVSQQPGRPFPILPDAFEDGARILVERR